MPPGFIVLAGDVLFPQGERDALFDRVKRKCVRDRGGPLAVPAGNAAGRWGWIALGVECLHETARAGVRVRMRACAGARESRVAIKRMRRASGGCLGTERR